MTMTKESLRKALERIDEGIDYIDPEAEVVAEAAGFVERLLPEKCDCDGTGVHPMDEPWPHPDCHGSGQVWDEGLVEVVADAIANNEPGLRTAAVTQRDRELARAVLSALTAEVSKSPVANRIPKDS